MRPRIAMPGPTSPSPLPPQQAPHLPPNVLTATFQHLSPESLARVACTCKWWRQLSGPAWRVHVERKWPHSDPSRWRELLEAGNARAVYSGRMQVDRATENAIQDMAWPMRAESALEHVVNNGLDCIDHLREAAISGGPLQHGRRHFANLLLQHCSSRLAELAMTRLLNDPLMSEDRIEEGAIIIAEAMDPLSCDGAAVQAALQALQQELRMRVQQLEEPTDSKVLEVLNQLLFGGPPNDTAPDEQDDSRFHVPPAPYGLGLKGDSMDYYSVHNSCVDKVLLERRRGIPITLSLIHMGLGRRQGLDLHMLGVPGHVVNCLGVPGEPGALFIDCFDGGRIMDSAEMRDLIFSLNIAASLSDLPLLPPCKAYLRMCMNLLAQCREHAAHEARLKDQVLAICTAVLPGDAQLLTSRLKSAAEAHNYGTALRLVDQRLQVRLAAEEREQEKWAQQAEESRDAIRKDRAQYLEQSTVVSRRSPDVRFRVGQIMAHRRHSQITGVIFGWGHNVWRGHGWLRPPASDHRTSETAPTCAHPDIFYGVLLHGQGSALVHQDDVLIISKHSAVARHADLQSEGVDHADIGAYFDGLDRRLCEYVPNSWLSHKYPDDRPPAANKVDMEAEDATEEGGEGVMEEGGEGGDIKGDCRVQ